MNITLREIQIYNADNHTELVPSDTFSVLSRTCKPNETVGLGTISDIFGLEPALCCLRLVPGHEREMRLYAVWCARHAQQHCREREAFNAELDVCEAYANGACSEQEFTDAQEAAWAKASSFVDTMAHEVVALYALSADAAGAAHSTAHVAAYLTSGAAMDAMTQEFVRMCDCVAQGTRYTIRED